MITKSNIWKYFKRIVITLLVLAVIAISGFLYFMHMLFGPGDATWRFKLQKFDREKWMNSAWINPNAEFSSKNRGEMIDDLEKNYFKKFMTEEEIIRLLGKPDVEGNGYIFWKLIKSKRCLVYVLGITPAFRFMYELEFCKMPYTEKYVHKID